MYWGKFLFKNRRSKSWSFLLSPPSPAGQPGDGSMAQYLDLTLSDDTSNSKICWIACYGLANYLYYKDFFISMRILWKHYVVCVVGVKIIYMNTKIWWNLVCLSYFLLCGSDSDTSDTVPLDNLIVIGISSKISKLTVSDSHGLLYKILTASDGHCSVTRYQWIYI